MEDKQKSTKVRDVYVVISGARAAPVALDVCTSITEGIDALAIVEPDITTSLISVGAGRYRIAVSIPASIRGTTTYWEPAIRPRQLYQRAVCRRQ